MDNITMTEEQPTNQFDGQVPPPAPKPEQRLTDVQIVDENTALNVMVSFLNLAQKRGTFSIDESAKIWECIQKFIQQQPVPDA
jgi:glutathione synthase/RimK-type ligase-like ATP-grasp enzyme